MSVHVKICGVTTVDDALQCARLGVSAIGLNFVPSSPRLVDVARARAITDALRAAGERVLVVGVVADEPIETLRALVSSAGLGCLQLHGSESPSDLAPLLPHAYKAVRIRTREDVVAARAFPGDYILVDAKVDGALGGTGESFDWSLVQDLARERKLTLAGGLHPGNVAEAIRAVRPWCVDVASGVERAGRPGVKDLDVVAAFLAAARSD